MSDKEKNHSLFTPDDAINDHYKNQLRAFLEDNSSKTALIDMGPLPAIYTVLGIVDKELKTNGRSILKALGFDGKNKHSVSKETIENLLSLTYDPEAVFKSLSASNNPNSFIAVLYAICAG